VAAWQHHGPARSVREDHMRFAIIGIVTLAAGLAADVQTASAQNESFFQKRYCARSGISRQSLNCAYDTMEQCMRIPYEPGRVCMQNPFWHGPREQPKTQGKKGRRNR
jgi:hypothetical protein